MNRYVVTVNHKAYFVEVEVKEENAEGGILHTEGNRTVVLEAAVTRPVLATWVHPYPLDGYASLAGKRPADLLGGYSPPPFPKR